MHKAVPIGVLMAILTAPVAAYAQPAARAPTGPIGLEFTIQPTQWLAIGAGVVVGAVLLDVILPTNVAYVVGGAFGGYLANAWYQGRITVL
jgi:hypothetical protein